MQNTHHLRIFVLYYNFSIGAIRVIILWEKQIQCYLSTAIPTIVAIDTFFIPRFAEIKTLRSFLPCCSAKQASLFCSHSLRQFSSYQRDQQCKPFVVEHSLGDKLDYDVNAAVEHLKNNAHEKSQGQCAKAVREALEAGGLNTDGRPASAKVYDNFLPTLGFHKVYLTDYTIWRR